MNEPIENQLGFWSINGKEYSGMLSFSQEDGIHVTILSTEMQLGFNKVESFPIITGVIETGEPITLVNCQMFNSNMRMRNIGESLSTYVEKAVIRAKYMLEGIVFDSVDDIKFRSLMGVYSDLDEWVDTSGFEIEHSFGENEDFEYSIKYQAPEPLIFEINSEISVGIGFSYHGPTQSMVQKKAQIEQGSHLMIRSLGDPIHFEELFTYLRWFSLLLQFGSQRKSYPMEILGIIDKEDNHEFKYSKRVKIYFQPIETIRDVSSIYPPFFYFTFNELGEEKLKNWFDGFNDLKTVVNLRSTLFLHERLFLETKFLNIIQALETIFSLFFDATQIDSEEFSKIKEDIISILPDEHKDIIVNKIGCLNYLPQLDKLERLFNEKEGVFSQVIYDSKSFCKRVNKTRNSIVHASSRKRKLSDKEIMYATELLKILFDSYLLKFLGFSEEEIDLKSQKRIDEYLERGIVFNK